MLPSCLQVQDGVKKALSYEDELAQASDSCIQKTIQKTCCIGCNIT